MNVTKVLIAAVVGVTASTSATPAVAALMPMSLSAPPAMVAENEFEMLLPSFAEAYQETLDKKRRWRAAGGGRKATLKTSADKLFFILL